MRRSSPNVEQVSTRQRAARTRPHAATALDEATRGGDAIAETTPEDITPRTTTSRRDALLSSSAAVAMHALPWASTRNAATALASAALAAARALVRPRAAFARSLAVVRSSPVVASDGVIALSVVLPPGYHLTKGANSRYEVEQVGMGDATLTVSPAAGKLPDEGDVRLKFATRGGGGGDGGEVRVNCTVYFCREDDICLLQRVRFEIPVVDGGGGSKSVAMRFDVPAADEQAAAPVASSPVPSLDEL